MNSTVGVPAPVLGLGNRIKLVIEREDEVVFHHPDADTTLRGLASSAVAAFRVLAVGGATLDEFLAHVVSNGGCAADVARVHYDLERLHQLAYISFSLVLNGHRLLTVEPIALGFRFEPARVNHERRVRLSQFAFCRRMDSKFMVETPLSPARVALQHPFSAAVVQEAAQPQTCRQLCTGIVGLSEEMAEAIASYLIAADVLDFVREDDLLPEDTTDHLMHWQMHDLAFHSRSRRGRHDYPVGAYLPLRGKAAPEPAIKIPPSGERIELMKPDIDELPRKDPPFTTVLERRRSIRAYADRPITLDAVGEFLFRAARIRRAYCTRDQGIPYEYTDRPYPSGGGAYELELYLTINACEGVPRGIYYYNALDHELSRINDEQRLVDALLNDAWMSAAGTVVPQILITITSRIRRLSWKYSSMAYATTLKNVGVLYQTMYLVAAAMGLAPCGLGTGNSALVAEAMRLDLFSEVAVGEFMLGSSPKERDGLFPRRLHQATDGGSND